MGKKFDTKPNSVVRERKRMKEQNVETAAQKPPISEEPSIGFDFAEQNTSITPANMPKHINVSAIPQEQEKAAAKKGQPKKYNEETKYVSYKLPVSTIEKLKTLAAMKQTSSTMLLNELINSKYTEVEGLAEKFKKLEI